MAPFFKINFELSLGTRSPAPPNDNGVPDDDPPPEAPEILDADRNQPNPPPDAGCDQQAPNDGEVRPPPSNANGNNVPRPPELHTAGGNVPSIPKRSSQQSPPSNCNQAEGEGTPPPLSQMRPPPQIPTIPSGSRRLHEQVQPNLTGDGSGGPASDPEPGPSNPKMSRTEEPADGSDPPDGSNSPPDGKDTPGPTTSATPEPPCNDDGPGSFWISDPNMCSNPAAAIIDRDIKERNSYEVTDLTIHHPCGSIKILGCRNLRVLGKHINASELFEFPEPFAFRVTSPELLQQEWVMHLTFVNVTPQDIAKMVYVAGELTKEELHQAVYHLGVAMNAIYSCYTEARKEWEVIIVPAMPLSGGDEDMYS